MIQLILPLPDKTLNPNTCRHYHVKAKIKAKARAVGYELSKQYFGVFFGKVPIKIKLIVHKNNKRSYDLDNVLAASKSIIDGVFDGLGINDNQIDDIRILRGEIDKENPRVEMVISEVK